ncbi:MAG: DUF447 family protein [Methylococcales bacterium]|nr:DUF447 family protein [Methylococcales bacterium]
MIQETLITTVNSQGKPHIAPMGVHIIDDQFVIMAFRPNLTLNNILETRTAVVNYCDDVRIFAGCLTGRRDWPLQAAEKIKGYFLADTLAHAELELINLADDPVRPKLFCKPVHSVNHKPFQGFNRAQYSVLEAAILISRLGRLPWDKIESELDYLRIGMQKTAGPREKLAWQWLMEFIEQHKNTGGNS